MYDYKLVRVYRDGKRHVWYTSEEYISMALHLHNDLYPLEELRIRKATDEEREALLRGI